MLRSMSARAVAAKFGKSYERAYESPFKLFPSRSSNSWRQRLLYAWILYTMRTASAGKRQKPGERLRGCSGTHLRFTDF